MFPTSGDKKFSDIHQVLTSYLPPDRPGGAIVYCATRRQSEEVAEYLKVKQVEAEYFHAGLQPESKKEVQRRFIDGDLRAIAATNAFGMGIDKPDVRLVIHGDIPGSLENYLQEAGRAGRDRESARCVLLYEPEDAERQFGMSARSRLTRREIHGILRALRNLDRKKQLGGEVVATPGEILGEDEEMAFERDSATDDTRVRTAVAWLEESELLTREENAVQVFPSSLRVSSVGEAAKRLEGSGISEDYRRQLLRISRVLIEADADEGITTDQLMESSGLSPEGARTALYDLERLGIASNDTVLTAFVHSGVERSSPQAPAGCGRARDGPDLAPAPGGARPRQGRVLLPASAHGLPGPAGPGIDRSPAGAALAHRSRHRLRRARRGRGRRQPYRAETGRGDPTGDAAPRVAASSKRPPRIRRQAAGRLLDHLLSCLPAGSRGTDLLAETTLGKLTRAIESDLVLKNQVRRPDKLLERALMWLHEQEVIQLNKGLAVFRPAMTIRLQQGERRGFAKADFEPLAFHYTGKTLQIHVMAEYAARGLAAINEAQRLAKDYFTLEEEAFLEHWLPGRDKEIRRQTTLKSWRKIVENLKNPVQQRIVADDREETNVLILAGPGLGQDAGAGASDRLSDTGATREPSGHPGFGLQPSRGGRYPAAPPGVDRRRCARRDRAYLPRPGDATGRSQLHRSGGASRRRNVPGGDPPRGSLAAWRRPAGGGGGREAGTPAGRLPLDPGGRVPGHRVGPV